GAALVLLSLILVVPALALLGRMDADPRRAWGEHHLEASLAGVSNWIERRPAALWTGSILVSVIAALGILRLEVETDFTRNFRAHSPVVQSYTFVEEHLGGAGVWDVIVPAPEVLDSAFLQKLSACEQRLRGEVVLPGEDGSAKPGLTKVLSL